VDCIVFIADFFGRYTVFDGFGFDSCAVFVCATDIESIDVAYFAVTGIYVCTQNRSNDIAEMGNVIDIWES
jgi:hypothetical protein